MMVEFFILIGLLMGIAFSPYSGVCALLLGIVFIKAAASDSTNKDKDSRDE